MPLELLLNILGSIASVFGAVLSWKEAKKSALSASQAKAFRDELIDRRKLVEVSQVHTETQRILKIVSDVGATATDESLKSVNVQAIAKHVEDYVRFLAEQSTHFDDLFGNRAQGLCNDLPAEVERLAQATDPVTIRNAGKSIQSSLRAFLPVAKDLTDQRKEKGP